MNHTSSHAFFEFTRRRFFATTVGAMVASVLPVKAGTKVTHVSLQEGDTRYHKGWEYWDGVTWVPMGEKRCTSNHPFHKDTRLHYHPGGKDFEENYTAWLEDERYPTIIWRNNEPLGTPHQTP